MSNIDLVNLRKMDLNLLIQLVALVEEGGVNKAAARLGLGQPAMSHALARLRHMIEDDILVRSGQGMQPTHVAITLAEQVGGLLSQLKAAVDSQSAFDPSTAARTFRLAIADKYEITYAGALADVIAGAGPSLALRILSIPGLEVARALEEGKVDAFLGARSSLPELHGFDPLYSERFVLLLPPDANAEIDIDAYCAADHVLGSVGDHMENHVDAALHKIGRKRRVAVSTPHILAMPAYVARGLVCTTVESFAQTMAALYGLRVSRVPIGLNAIEIGIAWHRRDERSAAHRWFRDHARAVIEQNRPMRGCMRSTR